MLHAQLCLAREVLKCCLMDFALVASDLSSTAIPIPQALPEEPNADWILNWLEAVPVVQAPVTFDSAPRLATVVLATTSTQIYDLAFEVVTPPTPEGETEAEDTAVVHTEGSVVELLSAEEPEVEPIDEEPAASSESAVLPTSGSTSTWQASTAPTFADDGAPRQHRGPDAPRLRPSSDPPERQMLRPPADKGEIIWEADLVVATPEVARASSASPNDLDLKPESAATTEIQIGSARREPDSQDAPTQQEQEPEDSRGTPAPEAKRKQAAQPISKPDPTGTSEPGPRVAKRVQSVERRESPLTFPPQRQTPIEVPVAATIERGEGPATVTEVAPAQPMRPAQVARVQVDLGAAGQAPGGDPAMRLVLTQRGENVSVQVRSWNDTAVPLTAREVHPLLENLAKQGLTPAAEASLESAPVVEAPKERAIAFGQPAASHADARGFHGFDERQQRQQEQHKQQQEVIARRQQRSASEFDLNAVLDEIQAR